MDYANNVLMMIGKLFRWLAAFASIAALTPASAFWFPTTNRVVEYQNDITGHYLLLASEDDMTYVDRGLAGPGWGRTGYYFENYTFNPNIVDLAPKPVCRFYSALNNSHFFTAYDSECETLKQPDTGWAFEKIAFAMEVPLAGGECAYRRIPVFRLYNNRHAQHDANHRYIADNAVRAQMIASGWQDEGIAFCASAAGTAPERSFDLSAGNDEVPLLPAGECEIRGGGCIGLTNLAAMPTYIPSWLPPSYVVRNSDYPWGEVEKVTGISQTFIRTAAAIGSPELLQRSFVQAYRTNPLPIGIHVLGSDRLSGVYAGASPMRVLPGGASAAGDDRVFPWRGTRNRTLVLNAVLSVTRARRTSESAHAYGHPMLEFVDRVSGRKFYVTLQAFGTLPAGDYVGPDATTGWAIVSTSFRTDPLFGKRLAGDYVQCDPALAWDCIPFDRRSTYRFAIDRADFQSVLVRARSVDPALSANVSDFFLASFRMHNETYLDAELGMGLYQMSVDIYVAGAPV